MLVFCLHYLGGSSREWELVAQRLDSDVRLIAIDLPGFGDAADVRGYSVAEMSAYVAQKVRASSPERFMLAGHSMGAKVIAALARRIEDGVEALPGLAGLVFLAGSPPSPEPMPGEQRSKMLAWFRNDERTSYAQAREYVSSNSGARLEERSAEIARQDVLRANRDAWVAWLEHGSREDWSQRIGVLQTPALVLAGADDVSLGASEQRRNLLPHLANATFVTLPDAKHLLPLECPDDVARTIDDHARLVDRDRAYRALIESPRTSTVTRRALLERGAPDDPAYAPIALDRGALETLRAVLRRVLPQTGSSFIDLGARVDKQLRDPGDGWRFAVLPPDAQAYAAGLATLDAIAHRAYDRSFAALDDARQDALLQRIAEKSHTRRSDAGRFDADPLNADQMNKWFEELRADAVKAYMLHPLTLARIGYSGIAYGGDGLPKSGFARIGYGERETWEPAGARGSHS